MRKVIIAALSLMCFAACKSNKTMQQDALNYDETTAFNFITDASLSTVVDKAKLEGKLVFIDIYTDWCLPCQIMNEEVFTDENLGEYFNTNFISYKVNAEKGHGPDIATIYNVQGYPTLLFVDERGRVLEQKGGLAFHSELKGMAQSSIEKYNAGKPSE